MCKINKRIDKRNSQGILELNNPGLQVLDFHLQTKFK